ncbi:DUF2637 domain-containing protein [Streptomyces tardus]|uniref:DUF2637 domain-containing protein n=1 Tax=Streptomyces tardus TaxID=2780544 RepID=UPI001F15ABAA|nr:DUF2637 domain-containing protein [Streptomyces tardus]
MPSRATPATASGASAIRAGVALLAAFAFALSYDALRQMAVAIHIRGPLTYAFPLVIDGFITIGIGALLMLRTAPTHSRLYVWALVGLATLTSIWANALHAVRLNQQTAPADNLRLDDLTVGILSAIAPLALAGAVHLYLVIQRHPTPTTRQIATPPDHAADNGQRDMPRRPFPRPRGDAKVAATTADVAHDATARASNTSEVAATSTPPATQANGGPGETSRPDRLALALTAPLGRGDRASRRHIETTFRNKRLSIGRAEADKLKQLVQAELDEAPSPAQAKTATTRDNAV